MSDTRNPSEGGAQDPARNLRPAAVSLGNKMPASARKVPVLAATAGDDGLAEDPARERARSEIAEGLSFVGNAVLTGVCTVKGRVEGNLRRAEGERIAVVVTETGFVKGDIVADQISVMGRTEGVLDAGGGSVTLHESANVSGHVRYFRLQVNGSELNATLERSAPKGSAQPAPGAPGMQAAAPAAPGTQAPHDAGPR